MMKKAVVILVAVILSSQLFAQQEGYSLRESSNKFIVSIVPQSTIEHSMRIDFERRLKNGTSLIFAPRFFVKSANNWDNSNNGKMVGVGAEFNQKLRINDLSKPLRGYISYGVLLNYYNVIEVATQWQTIDVKGVPTLEAVNTDTHVEICKFGPSLTIGLEYEPIERFVIDISAGVGARYGTVLKGNKSYINSHDGILDMGYTGVLPLGVVKLGIVF